MTAQEVFDQVVAHLRKQGAVSIGKSGACLYRSDDGKKCAVGCLIPDEVYHPSMEYLVAGKVIENYRELSHLYDHRALLESMQEVHDAFPISEWEWKFSSVAAAFKLIYSLPSSDGK